MNNLSVSEKRDQLKRLELAIFGHAMCARINLEESTDRKNGCCVVQFPAGDLVPYQQPSGEVIMVQGIKVCYSKDHLISCKTKCLMVVKEALDLSWEHAMIGMYPDAQPLNMNNIMKKVGLL